MSISSASYHLGRKIDADALRRLERRDQISIAAPELQNALPRWNQKLIYLGESAMIVIARTAASVTVPIRDPLVAI